mgnify:CR=1 FL=1
MKSGWFASLLMLVSTSLAMARAAVYYVDFDSGADTHAGTTPDAPFQRAPGDPRAEANAAAVKLAPGDTVVLKGGVVYRGRINVTASGEEGRPITIDGNSAGAYGKGPAILDGSRSLTGWQRCASAAEARGNPNWREIFYADIPGPVNWQNVNLTTTEEMLSVAQQPKPSDPFFYNRIADFYLSNIRIGSTFPGRFFFEPGSQGNRQAPLTGLLRGTPSVIQPIVGGAFSIEFDEPVTITAVGLQSARQVHVRDYAILGDGKELARGTLASNETGPQKLELPAPVNVKKLTWRLLSAQEGVAQKWTRLVRVSAFTPDGRNLVGGNLESFIEAPDVLNSPDPAAYDGMTVGFHAGNNFVSYRRIARFDPQTHRIYFDHFSDATYAQTRFALFNSVTRIGRPGEFSVEPTADAKVWRMHYWPKDVADGQPAEVGMASESVGVEIQKASHVVVRGLFIRRQGGANASGVMVRDSSHVTVDDCTARLVSGVGFQSVGAKNLVVRNCRADHNRNRGIFHRNGTLVSTLNCRLHRNGSTALGHYTVRGGVCGGNVVTGHRGTHANGLTFYVGCRDMVIERNEVYDGNIALTIQEAENMVIRNNILDGGGRNTVVGIWVATPFRDVQFLNNTIVGGPKNSTWAAAVFSNNTKPEGLVFRNNIIDGLAGNLPAVYEHNLYTSWGPNQKDQRLGRGERFEDDLSKIFVNPDARDYRLRLGSPAIGAGLPLDNVTDDFEGQPRPQDRPPDLGARAFR